MSGQWHGGKGSRRRSDTNDEAYRSNYDRIFGNESAKVTDGKSKDKGKGR